MQRRLLMLGVLAGAIIALAPAAMAAAIDGTGAVGTCPNAGKIGIKPPLALTDHGPALVQIQSKNPKGGTCSGGTGDGANIVSSQAKGSEMTATSQCTGLGGMASNTLTLTVKWKTAPHTPKLNPSTITITSESGGQSSDKHVTIDVSGTVTAGSFKGDSVHSHIKTDQDLNELTAACTSKGIKKITFGVAPSKDDSVEGSGSTTIN